MNDDKFVKLPNLYRGVMLYPLLKSLNVINEEEVFLEGINSLIEEMDDAIVPILIKSAEHNNFDSIDEFLNHMISKKMHPYKILKEYPVVEEYLKNSVVSCMKLFRQVIRRFNNIKGHIFKYEIKVRNIELLNESDRHLDGKRGVILTLDNGEKLVFKPVSRRQEGLFLILSEMFELDWMKKSIIKSYSFKDEYGLFSFQDFVEPEECKVADVAIFYERMGWLIALSQIFNISDLHSGNIIALGNNPVIIDSECFFQDYYNIPIKLRRATLTGMIQNTPKDGKTLFNPGALQDVTYSRDMLKYDVRNISDIKDIKIGKMKISNHSPLPLVGMSRIKPDDYIKHIIRGYTNAFDTSEKIVKDLIESHDIKQLVESSFCRIVLRNTLAYHQIIQRQLLPDISKSQEERWSYLNYMQKKYNINAFEMEQIKNWDYPYFSLECSTGNIVYGKNIVRTGMPSYFSIMENLNNLDKIFNHDIEDIILENIYYIRRMS